MDEAAVFYGPLLGPQRPDIVGALVDRDGAVAVAVVGLLIIWPTTLQQRPFEVMVPQSR
ncbi:hypothetical protein [Streptomyces sp. NPDC051135]|uniref:hypothetical protein n=1 Tax=unclassified Streptomyces TaxID=2593676 RepID=UPI00343A34D1